MSEAKERVLLTWLGRTDLDCASGKRDGSGPIISALKEMSFSHICLLWNYPAEEVEAYLDGLRQRFPDLRIEDREVALSSPTNYAEIYRAAIASTKDLQARLPGLQLTFHLSPGTPAMQAVWIILGKTSCPARLIESSIQQGVSVVDLPFDIAADFKPDRSLLTSALIGRTHPLAGAAAFAAIVGNSPVMQEAIARAQLAATQNFPVLILGESGTGKELFANAIHSASHRRSGPFVAINCGAIPANLLESELFGHEKGSFTGANATKKGCLERAHGGTLFLDELGELPLPAQVSLLRALQEQRIVRVGAAEEIAVDIRIVAATNRDLPLMIGEGDFRSDLYYRIAVIPLSLPALRERGSDLVALAKHLLNSINNECAELGHWDCKDLSAAAINVIKQHHWHGNVRELDNALRRAAIWSAERTISDSDMQSALSNHKHAEDDALNRAIGPQFDLDVTLDEVARHYLERAMAQTHGNKSEAARLLGLKSHQTLSNKLKKHGIE
jgi:DNA-binding NtrC family response regulator